MALNNHEITDEHLQQLEIIRINHDEAYLYVSQALSYQEHHQYSLAQNMYEKSLEKIDKAVTVRCDRPYCHGPKWDNARTLQQKMRKTTQMIKSQLRDIQNCSDALSSSNGASVQNTPPKPSEMPSSYDEACEHELLAVSRQPSNLDASDKDEARRNCSEALELFSVREDVMLFYVANDGSVSTTTMQSPLHIYQFVEHEGATNYVPPAWLQIGSWTYPLIPGQSPVLESGYGAFLFPNASFGQGSVVGVILPPIVDAAQRAEFLSILNSLTALRREKKTVSLPPEYASSTEKSQAELFSDAFTRGAEYLSAGIVKRAAQSSDLIHKEASKARHKIKPEDKPVIVDPRVKEGLKIAQDVSGVALKGSDFLMKKLSDLTLALGKQLSPFVEEQGSKLLSATMNKDKNAADETMDDMLTVAAGGLQGFSTVYSGLEQAARILACSLSQETVNVVGQKVMLEHSGNCRESYCKAINRADFPSQRWIQSESEYKLDVNRKLLCLCGCI